MVKVEQQSEAYKEQYPKRFPGAILTTKGIFQFGPKHTTSRPHPFRVLPKKKCEKDERTMPS
jgi:hypothetical protein